MLGHGRLRVHARLQLLAVWSKNITLKKIFREENKKPTPKRVTVEVKTAYPMPKLNVPQAKFIALGRKFKALVHVGLGLGKTWGGCADLCVSSHGSGPESTWGTLRRLTP